MDPELELVVGQRWSDFERAKSDVKSFLRRRAECWRGGSSNRSEWCLQCIDKECQFRIRIRRKDLVLTHYKSHTCPPSTHQNFKMHNSTKLLAQSRRARAIVGEDEFCKPKDLIRDERISTGIYIPYRQALRGISSTVYCTVISRSPSRRYLLCCQLWKTRSTETSNFPRVYAVVLDTRHSMDDSIGASSSRQQRSRPLSTAESSYR